MSIFFADLHIHSRYSRATSKNLTLRNIAAWAIIKGLDVVATGDFTHPGWLKEIEEFLEEKENGLLVLKDEKKKELEKEIPWWGQDKFLEKEIKFILTSEISSIYKKNKKVRKIHNVVFLSSIDKVKTFNRTLSKIGNLEADGRPILGLDSKNLLEIVLETDPLGFLIPAHIWTPWFSLFGANSGFDSIEECFGELSSEIFALETGLSSDPEMNWLWSKLDRFHLVSNSDAHSGEKLAREANMFSGEPSYHLIYISLKQIGNKHFLGTIEFFPEEGKYHLDGHRKCGVVLSPKDAIKLNNICPVCKQPLTIGVLHRIVSLADREKPKKPEKHPGFLSFIPLCEVLAEILGTGPKSKAVLNLYKKLITRFGPELFILKELPVEELKPISLWLSEALSRMRQRNVYRKPGFDGQYGQIFLFSPEEKKEIKKGKRLIKTKEKKSFNFTRSGLSITKKKNKILHTSSDYNPKQLEAIKFNSHPLLVVAGPGTGKTKTLIGKIEYLLSQKVDPQEILVVTFSRAASREIKERITTSDINGIPKIDTLHAVGYDIWSLYHKKDPIVLSEEESIKIFKEANTNLSQTETIKIWREILKLREWTHMETETEILDLFKRYDQLKKEIGVIDYQDLLEQWLYLMEKGLLNLHYSYVLVDEVQDLSLLQLKIIQKLLPQDGKGFFAIGDPNQSIYSFRGSLADIKKYLLNMWPNLKEIPLNQNYRSKQNLLDFVAPMFNTKLVASNTGIGEILFFSSQSQEQEAIWISKRIKELIGGTSHHEIDMGMKGDLSPSDIGVLFRFKALIPFYKNILEKNGIPVFVPEEAKFWEDPRIQIILSEVERVYGLSNKNKKIIIDDNVIKKGPSYIAKIYRDKKLFDPMFWDSKPFLELTGFYKKSKGWEDLLSKINMEKDFVQISEKAQKVFLITMHASKGLEFEAVFIPALENGILPFKKEIFFKDKNIDPSDMVEEKRLFYVALTRAKTFLFLSHAKQRKVFNMSMTLDISPFIKSVAWDMVKKIEIKRKKIKKEKRLKLI